MEIGEAQISLLERLCNACGVSGDEGEVRAIVLEELRPTVAGSEAELRVDALGNVLVTRLGQGEDRPRVMVAAHMDEVGLMLVHKEEAGIFRFATVGGLDSRQLAGKPVQVGREHVPGVIGAPPIHLSSAEERRRSLPVDALRIDVGPENGERVRVGDWASFTTPFSRLGPSLRAKALDDRLGVASLIELVKAAPPEVDLLAAFTVQEEIGMRGARPAAFALNPQAAIVLDCTPARDLPAWEAPEGNGEDVRLAANLSYNTRLGAGPAVYVADRATLSDPRLVRHFVETAQAAGLPYQFRQPGGGGTDAGAIHKQRGGIPSISISVPARYLHTAASLARLEDWQNTQTLVYNALRRFRPEILNV